MRGVVFVLVVAIAALGASWYVIEGLPTDAVAAGSVATARSRTPAAAVRPQQIQSVRLAGPRLPLTILESHLRTRVGDRLDADVLEIDRVALRDALVARGFWATEVGDPEVVFGVDGGAHVTFPVTPGVIFHVRAVTIAGGATPAGLPAALTLRAGDDVSPQRLTRNAELLAGYLERNGAPGADVTVETTTDRRAYAVDVRFVVKLPRR